MGVVANFAGIADPDFVRLGLVGAAIAQHQRTYALLNGLPRFGKQNHTRHSAHLTQKLARLLPGRVPGRDVADLVPKHPGKLRLVVKVRHDTTRKVHVAARYRESVHDRRIHNKELVRQIGPV